MFESVLFVSSILALLVVAVATIAAALQRVTFWKRIAQESQTSATFWRRHYEEQTRSDFIGQRPLVSVEREGPSRWLDVERLARGG